MFDPSTLNRAAHVLRTVTPRLPADAALRQELAANRSLSHTGKRSVARAVFAYYRWFRWLERRGSLQKQVDEALALQKRFDLDPGSFKPEALAARAVPDWLAQEVDLPRGSLATFQREPTLWIRARPGQAETLAATLGQTEPPPGPPPQGLAALPPDALRYAGTKDLFATASFRAGQFEIQDLASQAVGFLCDPAPGETWWDACAGEGGKSLHLADLLQNKGLIWATDRSARRLQRLRQRFARAKLFNVRTESWDGTERLPTRTKFDGILVDAPCSGVGTWQRNPHARWTTTPDDVAELASVQLRLLNHVAGSLKAGGRLIYSVCTLTRSETSAVADAFLASHPEFEPHAPRGGAPALTLWPHDLAANGMYIAVWKKR